MSNFRHNGYLIHYNHNHDALGRFSSGPGGIKTKISNSVKDIKDGALINRHTSSRDSALRRQKRNEVLLQKKKEKYESRGESVPEKFVERYTRNKTALDRIVSVSNYEITNAQNRIVDRLLSTTGDDVATVVDLATGKIRVRVRDGAVLTPSQHGINNVDTLTYSNYIGCWSGKLKVPSQIPTYDNKGKVDFSYYSDDVISKKDSSRINKDLSRLPSAHTTCQNQIVQTMYPSVSEWTGGQLNSKNYKKSDLKRDMQLEYVSLDKSIENNLNLSYGENRDIFGGHGFDADYDLKKKRATHSMFG